MRCHKKICFVLGVALAFAGCAADEDTTDGVNSPTIYAGSPARTLTSPSTRLPAQIAADFLRTKGRTTRTLDTLRIVSETSVNGLRHVQFEQVLDGLPIAGGYVKATFSNSGELLHLIDALVDVSSTVRPATIDENAALRAVLAQRQVADFYEPPTVERVLVRTAGSLAIGYRVETWTNAKNELTETLLGPDGRVLQVELRTANDSYNVFTLNPAQTPQAVVTNPADATASPAGWLSSSQLTTNMSGNNANAYLDTDSNNRPDRGGTAIAGTNFLAALDASSAPSGANNQTVAVQNLFFHNNLIHDTLYAAGFTEAEGNFQADNFGRGGRARDPVNAEAQDGGGTDNANFATPADGRSPRMQMYLWSPGVGVAVTSPSTIAGAYQAASASFGAQLDYTGVSGEVQAVGTACTADGALPALAGHIALIDRGNCTFVEKVKNAQLAGASAAIVANNDTVNPDSAIGLGGDDATITIAALGVSYNTGVTFKANAPVTATLHTTSPFMLDGDLDSDIMWHEYGHGLTWRMIGSMSGPMAGAIGEGMSDVNALIHGNAGDDRIGEYSYSDPRGLRRAPYGAYPYTYGSLNGPAADREVHNDGEIYGAIGYRLIQLYTAAGLTRAQLLADLVDGMRYTPARPTYEQMRDGILQGITNRGAGRECTVWSAFAQYGVGVGASGTENRDGSLTVVESFTKPANCQ